MAEELKPCPFCGGLASRQDILDMDECESDAGGSFIECDGCGACSAVHFDRKENLIDSWNRRSGSDRPATSEEIKKGAENA